MTERLSVDLVVEYNQVLCGDSGEHSALLDVGGLEAAMARPWSGFGGEEIFPSLFDKAAALLHAIASRQVFENGNKRTAWAAAVAFLDINDVDIGEVETVQSDMFVRAAALDHSLEISDFAEWFQVAAEAHVGPSLAAPRFGITNVGEMVFDPQDGSITPTGWVFSAPGFEEDQLELVDVDGIYAGWSVQELHVVMHGRPCGFGLACPLHPYTR